MLSASSADQEVFRQSPGAQRFRHPSRFRTPPGPGVAGGLVDIPGNQNGPWLVRAFVLVRAEDHGFGQFVTLDQLIQLGDHFRELESPHSLGVCL